MVGNCREELDSEQMKKGSREGSPYGYAGICRTNRTQTALLQFYQLVPGSVSQMQRT